MRRHRRSPQATLASRAGFTLIEVMVAISILVSITALIWVTMSSMFSAREYFQTRYERFQIVRNAMSRMSTELAAAFMAGPQHGGMELPGQERDPTELEQADALRSIGQQPIQFGFMGTDERVDFTAFAHARTQPYERSSEYAEISYYTRRERDELTGDAVRQLVRREDTTPDDRLDRGGTIYVMVPDVDEVEFEYWDPGQVQVGTLEEVAEGRWVTDWDTARREYSGRLPTRVRVTVTLPPQRDGDEPETFVTQTEIGASEVLEF